MEGRWVTDRKCCVWLHKCSCQAHNYLSASNHPLIHHFLLKPAAFTVAEDSRRRKHTQTALGWKKTEKKKVFLSSAYYVSVDLHGKNNLSPCIIITAPFFKAMLINCHIAVRCVCTLVCSLQKFPALQTSNLI